MKGLGHKQRKRLQRLKAEYEKNSAFHTLVNSNVFLNATVTKEVAEDAFWLARFILENDKFIL